jgi:hypothetical protein
MSDLRLFRPEMRYELAGRSLIAFGLLLLLGSIVALFFFHSLMIDLLAVMVIPLGFNVARRSVRATRWSIPIMAWYLFIAVTMLVIAAIRPESIKVGGRCFQPADRPWVLAGCVTVGIWSALNIALLSRALRSLKERPKRLPRAVWLVGGALACLIWVFAAIQLFDKTPRWFAATFTAVSTPGRLWVVNQAEAKGELVYVVFEGAHSTDGGLKSRVTISGRSPCNEAKLDHPDGSVRRLPGKPQLMEVVDGVYRESERTVTLAELRAFLNSSPAAYTIDDLLRFVDARQAQQ